MTDDEFRAMCSIDVLSVTRLMLAGPSNDMTPARVEPLLQALAFSASEKLPIYIDNGRASLDDGQPWFVFWIIIDSASFGTIEETGWDVYLNDNRRVLSCPPGKRAHYFSGFGADEPLVLNPRGSRHSTLGINTKRMAPTPSFTLLGRPKEMGR